MNNAYKRFLKVSIVMLIILVSIESLFFYIAQSANTAYIGALLKQARVHYNEIQNTRKWNAKLGGIYVRSNTLQPNEYLKDKLIDLGKDKRFIKINPAWMTRMLSESQVDDSYNFKLLSNTPINPINKAKGFYAQALKRIDTSKKDFNKEQYEINTDTKTLRYIHPVYVENACLECHKEYGFSLGELRGGIAVEIDASFYLNRISGVWLKFWLVTLVFTIMMILFLYVYKQLSNKSVQYEDLSNILEEEIKAQSKKFKLALHGSRLGYWHWNIKTHAHEVDERWLNMLGLTHWDVHDNDSDWKERIHPDDKKMIMPIINKAIKNKSPYVVEFRMLHKNGTYVWIQGSGAVTKLDKQGEALELSGTHQKINHRKALEIKNKSNELYLKTLFAKNPNIIIITDSHKIQKANDAFFNFFNEYSTLEDFTKEHSCICDFFKESKNHDTISNVESKWINEVLESSEAIAKITYAKKEHYFNVDAKKIYENNEMHMIVTFSDITEMYLLKQEFEQLSIIDALTNVYNRRHFNNVFPIELNRARRSQQTFSFAIIDVDNFKLYNDTYGHDAGDAALISLTTSISNNLQRSTEIFFRLGGEEFGIIFSNYSEEESLKYTENLCRKVEENAILHEQNLPFKVLTISIGLCYLEPTNSMELNTIYKNADKALYEAKHSGRNQVVLSNVC
ncbi:MAG: diguanylate cyclase [Sulfurimonas sp.]